VPVGAVSPVYHLYLILSIRMRHTLPSIEEKKSCLNLLKSYSLLYRPRKRRQPIPVTMAKVLHPLPNLAL
jgi:hypothetical protein